MDPKMNSPTGNKLITTLTRHKADLVIAPQKTML